MLRKMLKATISEIYLKFMHLNVSEETEKKEVKNHFKKFIEMIVKHPTFLLDSARLIRKSNMLEKIYLNEKHYKCLNTILISIREREKISTACKDPQKKLLIYILNLYLNYEL